MSTTERDVDIIAISGGWSRGKQSVVGVRWSVARKDQRKEMEIAIEDVTPGFLVIV